MSFVSTALMLLPDIDVTIADDRKSRAMMQAVSVEAHPINVR